MTGYTVLVDGFFFKDFYFLCRLAEEIVNQDGDHSVIQCLDQVRLIFQSSQIDACFFSSFNQNGLYFDGMHTL